MSKFKLSLPNGLEPKTLSLPTRSSMEVPSSSIIEEPFSSIIDESLDYSEVLFDINSEDETFILNENERSNNNNNDNDNNNNGKKANGRGINLLELPFASKKTSAASSKIAEISNEKHEYEIENRLIESIIKELEAGIFTAPLFQRWKWAWPDPMKKSLIASIMSGFPIPNITVNNITKKEFDSRTIIEYGEENPENELLESRDMGEMEENEWKPELAIIDGRHRLITIWNYCKNMFSFDRKNHKTGKMEHVYFKDLTSSEKYHFLHYKICFYILKNWSDKVCRKYFQRLNSGANLKPAERLNAYVNPTFEFIRSLDLINEITLSMKELSIIKSDQDIISVQNIIIKGTTCLLFPEVVGISNTSEIMDKSEKLSSLTNEMKEKIKYLIESFSIILKQIVVMRKYFLCKISEAEIYSIFHFIKMTLDKNGKTYELSFKKTDWDHFARFYIHIITANRSVKDKEKLENVLFKNYMEFMRERKTDKQRLVKMRDTLYKLYQEYKSTSFSEKININQKKKRKSKEKSKEKISKPISNKKEEKDEETEDENIIDKSPKITARKRLKESSIEIPSKIITRSKNKKM
jgi:hypothetical protein